MSIFRKNGIIIFFGQIGMVLKVYKMINFDETSSIMIAFSCDMTEIDFSTRTTGTMLN